MKNENTNKKEKTLSTSQSMARETYLDYAGKEAVERVGKGPQLKGTIHEITFRDSKNLSIQERLQGKVTMLTVSTTAKTNDLITVQNGKVAGRYQLKDVISKPGIRDIQQKVEAGQYRSAQLVGTEETSKLYNETATTSKTMKSSGISSKTTTRAADNAGANVPDKNLLINNIQDIGQQAKVSSVYSAGIGVCTEAARSYKEYKSGGIDGFDYAERIVVTGVKSATTSACKTAAALGMKEGAKAVAKQTGKEALRRAAGSNAATGIMFGMVEQVCYTYRYASGKMDGGDYGVHTAQNIGSTGGAGGGAAVGAMIGSVVPVVGTAIGAIIGGFLGGLLGGTVGKNVGKGLFK